MHAVLNTPISHYRGGLALAHSQVDDQDPLRFFVLKDGAIVVNPVITRHTEVAVYSTKGKEGCLSYLERHPVLVPRYHKIEVEYYYLNPDGTLSEKFEDKLKGNQASIFQHEIDHFDAIYIYHTPDGSEDEPHF